MTETFMQILVWNHKHGTEFYDASTPDALDKSARLVLKQLLDMQYIGEPSDPMMHIQYSNIDLEQANLTDEQIDALPTASLRDTAKKHKRSLERRLSQYARDLAEHQTVLDLIAGKEIWERNRGVRQSGARKGEPFPDRRYTAWDVLSSRSGFEYENYSIETVIEHNNEETS